MHPIRLLILAVLFYILYRLLFGGRKKKAVPTKKPKIQVQDTLVEDPICHTYVPESQSLSVVQGGKTYYFCSQECLDTFTEHQERSDS